MESRERRERRRSKEESGRPSPVPEELRRRKREEQAKLFNLDEDLMEKEGWQEANRKEHRNMRSRRRVERSNKIPATSFFISNLPEGIKDITLLKNFAGFGDLLSVYVAKKRDKFNNLFGFLRFANVSDINELEASMNNVCIDGAKIGVNVAKYDRWFKDENIKSTDVGARKDSSRFSRSDFMHPVWNRKEKDGKLSYKEVLSGSSLSNNHIQGSSKTVMLAPSESLAEKSWLKSSLVGEVKTFTNAGNLQVILKELGVPDVQVRYLGGVSMMMTFDNSELANEFLLNRLEDWKKIFTYLVVWDGTYNQEERFLWLIIKGVPVSLWDPITFDIVGNSFGNVVIPSGASVLSKDLSYDRVGILVRGNKMIDEHLIIKRKDQTFRVHVYEDRYPWSPENNEKGRSNRPEFSETERDDGTSKEETIRCSGNSKTKGLEAQNVSHESGIFKNSNSHVERQEETQRSGESGGPFSSNGPKTKKRRKNKRKRSSGSPGSSSFGPQVDLGPSLECIKDLIHNDGEGSGGQSTGRKTGGMNDEIQVSPSRGLSSRKGSQVRVREEGNGSITPDSTVAEKVQMEEMEIETDVTLEVGAKVGVNLEDFRSPVRDLIKGEVLPTNFQ